MGGATAGPVGRRWFVVLARLVALPLLAAVALLGVSGVAGAQEPAPAPPPESTTTTQPPAPTTPPPPLWDPPRVAHVDVNVKRQRVYVVGHNGAVMADFPMSSGKNGSTPRGTFRVYSRSASTVSLTDRAVSMRWMTRFNGGIGFHGIPRKGGRALSTPLGQRAVSAGCIRLADGDAEWIYRNVPTGTPVNVIAK